MFNLIMRSGPWNTGVETMPLGRMFEYTELHVAAQFQANDQPDVERLTRLPCLFMPEGRNDERCYVGSTTRARIASNEVNFEYVIDQDIPALRNETIWNNRAFLDMPHDFEFSRNHWAVKDVDLYRMLLRQVRPRRQRPVVFHIDEHESIQPTLVSAMMPFDAGFNDVYASIRQAAENAVLVCRRADDIWNNPAIIQDVVGLIDHSRIVVCYCTGRNPNVFYEAGIAHTLGREVILITQSGQDIPFDLRHLRYVLYLNNGEGRAALTETLQARMQAIVGN